MIDNNGREVRKGDRIEVRDEHGNGATVTYAGTVADYDDRSLNLEGYGWIRSRPLGLTRRDVTVTTPALPQVGNVITSDRIADLPAGSVVLNDLGSARLVDSFGMVVSRYCLADPARVSDRYTVLHVADQ